MSSKAATLPTLYNSYLQESKIFPGTRRLFRKMVENLCNKQSDRVHRNAIPVCFCTPSERDAVLTGWMLRDRRPRCWRFALLRPTGGSGAGTQFSYRADLRVTPSIGRGPLPAYMRTKWDVGGFSQAPVLQITPVMTRI